MTKNCRDCKWCNIVKHGSNGEYDKCTRPDRQTDWTDLERKYNHYNHCGSNAKYFEQKPPPPPTVFQRIVTKVLKSESVNLSTSYSGYNFEEYKVRDMYCWMQD